MDWDRLRLRVYTYSGRISHAIAGGLARKCCYMHLPKCGGTSVGYALRRLVPIHRHVGNVDPLATRRAAAIELESVDSMNIIHEDGSRCAELFEFRRHLVLSEMAYGCDLVTGHFLFDRMYPRFFGKHYEFISVMREPEKRVVSNYRSSFHEKFVAESFSDYLATDVAWRHATLALRYFSGIPQIDREGVDEALALAKENMRYFALIGFQEDFSGFVEGFNKVFEKKPWIRHFNKAKIEPPSMLEYDRKRLADICEPDRILYEHARTLTPGRRFPS